MRVLLRSGVVKEIISAEVKPMDVGNGEIFGTQVNFITPDGNTLEYVYNENLRLEQSGQMAVEFIDKLYKNGFADFSSEPVEQM